MYVCMYVGMGRTESESESESESIGGREGEGVRELGTSESVGQSLKSRSGPLATPYIAANAHR